MKKTLSLLCAAAFLLLCLPLSAGAAGAPPDVTAPSWLLMERETGTVLCRQNARERLAPASVTKVMTLLLVMEAIERGELALTDTVTASAHAAGMGGSQIYLREGEQMSCEDLLKSVVIASANDAAVALAEHLCGSEEVFVSQMNRRAEELGMTDTCFLNCTGLPEPEHLTSARDIALMSRQLLQHDQIRVWSTTWMDSVRGGEFGLTNTNRLVRFYEGATGLKTGFTNTALFCLAASAERDGMELICVVLKAPTSDDRFEAAKTLLNYGFANYTLLPLTSETPLAPAAVRLGCSDTVAVETAEGSLVLDRTLTEQVEIRLEMPPEVDAPVRQGQKLGELRFTANGQELAAVDVVAAESVGKLSLTDIWKILLCRFFGS